jgi:hypothetical protein
MAPPQPDVFLARQCAPVLARIKPAALFALPDWWGHRGLLPRDKARMRMLTFERPRAIAAVFAYDPQLLDATLAVPRVRRLLEAMGYPASAGLSANIQHLGGRFRDGPGFPHEVGLFLGYPPEDVLGFIQNGGRHFKACGAWKVYGDARRAGATFARYRDCTARMVERALRA